MNFYDYEGIKLIDYFCILVYESAELIVIGTIRILNLLTPNPICDVYYNGLLIVAFIKLIYIISK